MIRNISRILLVTLGLLVGLTASAQRRRVMNKPFIDTRVWHWGFNIGLHDQGLGLHGNGLINHYTTPEGTAVVEQWVGECDRQNFGFTVGVLGSLKVTNWLDMRINPSMNFGSKHIQFVNLAPEGGRQSQDMKSTYIALPVDFKMNAPRFNNFRPYVLLGASAQYDLTTTKHAMLRCKPLQGFLEAGFGVDLYMPFFKLIPELKFSFGLGNVIRKRRPDLLDAHQLVFTESIDKGIANMVTLNLYFE